MTDDAKTAVEITACVAFTCLGFGFLVRRKEVAPGKWPQVPGKIVTSMTRRQSIRPGEVEVQPVIEYEFQYNGASYRSSRWRFGNYSLGNSYSANPICARYPVGSLVTVYVNAEQPEESVLMHGTSPLSWFPIGFGIGFVVVALLVLLL